MRRTCTWGQATRTKGLAQRSIANSAGTGKGRVTHSCCVQPSWPLALVRASAPFWSRSVIPRRVELCKAGLLVSKPLWRAGVRGALRGRVCLRPLAAEPRTVRRDHRARRARRTADKWPDAALGASPIVHHDGAACDENEVGASRTGGLQEEGHRAHEIAACHTEDGAW